ncbi:MAG TPA: TIGR00153 family protein [Candidatus Methanofastidiosa archaeon]|nr:TIGR00153 family protein [Candidatus Methanofastidiosa archaeon]
MPKKFLDRFRVPIIGTLSMDPFVNLIEHAKVINECTIVLKEAVDAYFSGDFESFRKYREIVIEKEEQADRLKRNIRNHLPSRIHMSVDKSNFLLLLTQQDKILDYEEDVVQWLSMREVEYCEDISKEFERLIDKTIETIDYFQNAVFNLPEVLESSFSQEERNETKKYIKMVSHSEYESDLMEHEVSKTLFNLGNDMSYQDFYHLMRTVHLIGEISNHAENAADRVRALLAK